MISLRLKVVDSLSNAFTQLFPEHQDSLSSLARSVTKSSQPQFGHFQSNAAMQLTKQLKMPPREIASLLADSLLKQVELFSSIDVAGPGFINITLTNEQIASFCNAQFQHEKLGCVVARPDKIIVDFSSPNIAKEMHVGHLRSTIIGDCMANVFEFLGHEVLRLNHVGDWGTAFGMLIVYLKQHQPEVLSGDKAADLTDLVGWYKQSKACFDADPTFKKASQLQVVELQQGDTESLRIWKLICDISRTGFQRIYNLLNIRLTERGESFYNPWLNECIDLIDSQGLLSISDGASCVYLDGFQNRDGDSLPLIVKKSDGGFNYASTDLAAIRHRAEVEQAKRVIYVTDSGQSLHFSMVFAAAKKARLYSPDNVSLEHAGFGLVLGDDGKKFKTRSGDVVRLQSLLDKAIDKSRSIFMQRHPDWDQAELDRAAYVLGIGAVKYADLSNNRISDYQFSFDKMLNFDGNTAAFILYSYVRIKSIIEKSSISKDQIQSADIELQHPGEVELALHLTRFPDTVAKVSADLNPHYLTDYLYLLAQKYNSFFRDCRVIGDERELSRLLICQLSSRILEQGLQLLGIEVLSRM